MFLALQDPIQTLKNSSPMSNANSNNNNNSTESTSTSKKLLKSISMFICNIFFI